MHGVIPRTPPRSKVLTINKDATTPNLLRVTIVNMSNLRLKKSDKDKVNPMVQIQFEGETFKTRQYTDSRFPTYEQSFLFMLPSHPKKARKGVSQALQRYSYLQTISYFRRIVTPSVDSSTQKVVSIRHARNNQYGFLDLVETPEGSKIGLLKHLALMADVTLNLKSQELRQIFLMTKNFEYQILID